MHDFINFLNKTAQSGHEYVLTDENSLQCWSNNILIMTAKISDKKRQDIENANYNDYSNVDLDWRI